MLVTSTFIGHRSQLLLILAPTSLVPMQLARLQRSLFALYSAAADVVAATAATVTSWQHDDVIVATTSLPLRMLYCNSMDIANAVAACV